MLENLDIPKIIFIFALSKIKRLKAMKEFATFEFFSPLAQMNGRLCADYTVYVSKYKNGNISFKCYDGACQKPYICIRSTSAEQLNTLLKTYIPQYESSGCKMVAYIDEDVNGVTTIFK